MLQSLGKNSGLKVGSVIVMLVIGLVNIMFAGSVVKSGLEIEELLLFSGFFFVSTIFGVVLLAVSKVSVGDFVKITKAFGNFVKAAQKK
jgi:uncharacterized membrane protein